MPKHSSDAAKIQELRDKIIGLGEDSIRKSYYPKLRYHIDELKRFRALLDQSKELILLVDFHTREIVDINYTVSLEYGYAKDTILGKSAKDFFPQEIIEHMDTIERGDEEELKECCIIEVDIETIKGKTPIEFSLQRIEFEESSYILITGTNITERKRAKQKIYELDFYDTLTGLANKKKLKENILALQKLDTKERMYSSLLIIDLDNFKAINDTKGHSVGDKLLMQISKRLKTLQKDTRLLHRSGGDEFAILLCNLSSSKDRSYYSTEELAFRIKNIINQPCVLGKDEFLFSSSIGVEVFQAHNTPYEEILKRAEIAMYESKNRGRNTISFYDPKMQEALEDKMSLETELKTALIKDQFTLYYQPQLDINENIIGLEALIRWNHPTRGLISPLEFIPLAEESGFIIPLGQWVLQTACRQLAKFAKSAKTKKISLSVNVSMKQFQDEHFIQSLADILHETDAPKKGLLLELTESIFIDDINSVIKKMDRIKELGVTFSMDDFGTGYSSLSSLKKLPLYELKVDQSFVRDIAEDPNDAVIVKTIIGMAKNLGLKVVAEGVENESQFEFLKRYNCDLYQGYYFAKPLAIEEIEKMLSL